MPARLPPIAASVPVTITVPADGAVRRAVGRAAPQSFLCYFKVKVL